MARKTVLVSDLSDKEIEDGMGATVTIKYDDARRGMVTLDVEADEVSSWAEKGRKSSRRGRRPAVTA